jgi:hypothetical protein
VSRLESGRGGTSAQFLVTHEAEGAHDCSRLKGTGRHNKKDLSRKFQIQWNLSQSGFDDPVAIEVFEAKDLGNYQLNDVYLCVRLTEPYEKDNHRRHKLVAAIMKNPPR